MKRTKIPNYKTKWKILENAYGVLCYYCRKNIATQLDHIIPYSYSLDHSIDNLILSCQQCNLIVSDKVFSSLREKENFIRKNSKNKSLVCSNCFILYYSSLSNCNSFLCPLCYSLEYDTKPKTDWLDWLKVLEKAEIDFQTNVDLSHYLKRVSLSKEQKINFLKGDF